jgi:hypothetical protein
VGVLGFEPRTSALSELRSSQLSYTPDLRNAVTRHHQTKKPNHIRFGSPRQSDCVRKSYLAMMVMREIVIGIYRVGRLGLEIINSGERLSSHSAVFSL